MDERSTGADGVQSREQVVDVRPPEGHADGHPSRARGIPLPRLAALADRLDRDRPVRIWAGTGRSARFAWKAVKILRDLGFRDVEPLGG